MSSTALKQLPYGVADFGKIRRNHRYYVDKTQFLPLLESSADYVFLIRPRRFGKSLWLSVLEHYYDIAKKEQFDDLFANTYIGDHPTEERNSYLVMMFNFAMVNPDLRFVQDSFEENGKAVIRHALRRDPHFFSEEEQQAIRTLAKTEDQLRELCFLAAEKDLKIYILVDEYDNFANTILTTAGEQAYRDLTHGAGFFRYFFNLLKGATAGQGGGIDRLFITGVSPITMDDVTSGFNIGENISLAYQFHDLLGFREEEVVEMLQYYETAGVLKQDVGFCLDLMKTWYNQYRFAKRAETPVFNPDMVLYFLKHVIRNDAVPDEMIDHNVRIDYGKLRHLILVDRKFNGNFSILREIVDTGEIVSDLQVSFPLEHLLNRENFVSLLFYLGLISIAETAEGAPVLRVPNLTIKQLMYGYLRNAYEEVNVFRLDLFHFAALIRGMAYRGEWEAVFNFLAEQVEQQTSVRDYLEGEKVIQGFLLAYLNVTSYYLTWSEREMGKGFADIYLEPFLARFPDMRFGYLIELKYLKRSEFSKEKLQEAVKEAKDQLECYAADEWIQALSPKVTLKRLILVYNGWQLVHREALADQKE